ncbi:MAG: hypothetical protein CBD97_00780 [Pelagibacteraceae bacterium TMED237]|nr:hypothetical protein [Candidatus Neomarinimicrobiota bacterium]OUW96752.1 MAG: hypothetical protein CBD97_00780 [Pelagibacteraceae bacterium TMED237]|tara:strand:- start:2783 stop:4516 length:1734 start_codon:yes stop_codon:yes gene_type:complete
MSFFNKIYTVIILSSFLFSWWYPTTEISPVNPNSQEEITIRVFGETPNLVSSTDYSVYIVDNQIIVDVDVAQGFLTAIGSFNIEHILDPLLPGNYEIIVNVNYYEYNFNNIAVLFDQQSNQISFLVERDCSILSDCGTCIDQGCFWQPTNNGSCFDECLIADLECYGQTSEWSAACPNQSNNCCIAYNTALNQCGDMIGCQIPQCQEDCSWEPVQCWSSTGYCWCVDENGDEVQGTSIPVWEGLPNCEEFNESECIELEGLYFGDCEMFMGIVFLDGNCRTISGCGWIIDGIDYSDAAFESIAECEQACEINSCQDIENMYNELHSGSYISCEDDSDCTPIWGDCGQGLGSCHYAVNSSNYLQNEVDNLVDQYFENDCISSVCDCLDLPGNAICNSGLCELAYCPTPNPAGCFSSNQSCLDGYQCIQTGCVPSFCDCNEIYGEWTCTEDCGGGICSLIQSIGDINNDGSINVSDIILLVSFILQIASPDSNQLIAADLNLDETLSVLDIVLLVNMILNPSLGLPDQCYLEPEPGQCLAAFDKYFFNQETNSCQMFIWGGCGGIVPFNSLLECQNICE